MRWSVTGTDRLLVTQFLVGQNFTSGGQANNGGAGDPSMSTAIPTAQYRADYEFLVPATYTSSYVNVAAPVGATVTLDGTPLDASEFTPIASSGWQVARHPLAGGAHRATSTVGFGIVVYGYASYTSYMYPGGLNFGTITIAPH